MNDLNLTALESLYQRCRAAIDMAATLQANGTPLATALHQSEHRVRALELPPGFSRGTRSAASEEQRLMLDLLRRARLEPNVVCPGQDPLDWLAMVIEDRQKQIETGPPRPPLGTAASNGRP